ncbi:uncharacterized protein LOC101861366 [Aplysia californica]|uniref:Uncharacterized protein LOC101861366 n=1 Tax=Aplysia californica TaxID=6500 RepID=A0ABM1A0Z2_APLCA|nr:uncharacterized protein LOC101861366 [Aplysia californica]
MVLSLRNMKKSKIVWAGRRVSNNPPSKPIPGRQICLLGTNYSWKNGPKPKTVQGVLIISPKHKMLEHHKLFSGYARHSIRTFCSSKLPDKWEQEIDVRVPCADFKGHWKIKTLRVSVLDSHPEDVDQERMTVVAVHGTPETEFRPLAEQLHGMGVRLIAPKSLGTDKNPTDPDAAPDTDFSADGRVARLKAIIQAKNVSRVDMLLGHGAGVWTMLKAGASWPNIHSLVCLNPAGSTPLRYYYPYKVYQLLLALTQHVLGQVVLVPLLEFLYKNIGFKSGSVPELFLITYLYASSNSFQNILRSAAAIRDTRIPLLYIYCEDDRIASSLLQEVMTFDVLRIPSENIVRVSADGKGNMEPLFIPKGPWFVRCLVLARGGHQVHRTNQEQVVQQIEDLLRRVRDLDWPNDDTGIDSNTELGPAEEKKATSSVKDKDENPR